MVLSLNRSLLVKTNVKLASLKRNSSFRELSQFGLHCMHSTYDWLDSINDRQRMQGKTTCYWLLTNVFYEKIYHSPQNIVLYLTFKS